MGILVAHASKHGSTVEIAQRVAQILTDRGAHVTCVPVADVESLEGINALVLGGAIYAGAWPKEAAAFVDRVTAEAPGLPAWVFSSGPVGEPPQPAERPKEADAVADRLKPRDHVVFAGSIDRSRLSLVERGIVGALRIPNGDFRDWAAIESWAQEIAAPLDTEPGTDPAS